jgi:hypothetical protein
MRQENEFCGSWMFRCPYRPLIDPAPYLTGWIRKRGRRSVPIRWHEIKVKGMLYTSFSYTEVRNYLYSMFRGNDPLNLQNISSTSLYKSLRRTFYKTVRMRI